MQYVKKISLTHPEEDISNELAHGAEFIASIRRGTEPHMAIFEKKEDGSVKAALAYAILLMEDKLGDDPRAEQYVGVLDDLRRRICG